MIHASTPRDRKNVFLAFALFLAILAGAHTQEIRKLALVCDFKDNIPYLTPQNDIKYATKPGSIIEFIRLMEAELGLEITIVREPVEQAMSTTLKFGKADGFFGVPYSSAYATTVTYPLSGGKPDVDSALFSTPFCLYKPLDSSLAWNAQSKTLSGNPQNKPIGVAYGSEIIPELKALNLDLKSDFSTTLSAFINLGTGDLAAVVARESSGDRLVAGNAAISKTVAKIAVPVASIAYYAVLTQTFTKKNPVLSRFITEYVRTRKAEYRKIEDNYR